jgi:hypothetical protein
MSRALWKLSDAAGIIREASRELGEAGELSEELSIELDDIIERLLSVVGKLGCS